MIRITLNPFALSGPPRETATFLLDTSRQLTNQEMADLAGVSLRTVERWRREPEFPCQHKQVAALAFIKFLLNFPHSKSANSRQALS